jgi:cytoskeletal protein RodZ
LLSRRVLAAFEDCSMKEWMLPVFIVVVWIVQAILRNREQDEPTRAAKNKSGERSGNRNAGSEIDKFLQEIERMKKKAAEERPDAPKPPPRVRPASPQPPRVKPVTPRIKVQPAPVVAPPVIALQPAVTMKMSQRPIAAAPQIAKVRRSAGVLGAIGLLRSPNSVASAIVLNEILGPPKCKRP